MRATFINTLIELAREDSRIVLLTADLGYTVIEPFANEFPDRFFNAGVAEQNMVGMATGLAEAHKIPFLYSIMNFAALRPYEFIRNGPVAHQLPVRIIGVGEGFDYGPAGVSHYGLEDVGVMRLQKGMAVVVPADIPQARTALLKTWNHDGPIYYRVGKGDKRALPNLDGRFEWGKAYRIRQGNDLAFVSMGGITQEVLRAAEVLETKGITSSIIVVPSFNPSPEEDLAEMLKGISLVLTVEAHAMTGGVGSFVCEVVAERNLPCQVIRCGIKGPLDAVVGSKDFMNHKHRISTPHLVEAALKGLESFRNERTPDFHHPARP